MSISDIQRCRICLHFKDLSMSKMGFCDYPIPLPFWMEDKIYSTFDLTTKVDPSSGSDCGTFKLKPELSTLTVAELKLIALGEPDAEATNKSN